MHKIILVMAAIYFLSHLFAALFARTRIPDVLLLTVLGLILGPFTGSANVEDFGKVGEVLSAIALAVILFEGGVSINMRRITSVLGQATALTVLTFTVTALVTALLTIQFLDFSLFAGVLTGVILGGVSPAVVIPLAKGLNLSERTFAIVTIECALSDVLAVVLAFGLLAAQASGHLDMRHIGVDVLLSLLVGAAIGIVGGLGWLAVLSTVRGFPNSTLTTIGFLLLLYALTDLLHFSGAITAFFFGLTLANYDQVLDRQHRLLQRFEFSGITAGEHDLFQELIFILKTFFFVYLGISFTVDEPLFDYGHVVTSPGSAAEVIWLGVAIVILVYVLRIVVARATLPRSLPWRDSAMACVLIPKGLAAAVLAGLPAERGVPEGQVIQSVVYSALIAAIVWTALWVPLIDNTKVGLVFRRLFDREPQATSNARQGRTDMN